MKIERSCVLIVSAVLSIAARAGAQDTARVSVATGGGQVDNGGNVAILSADGRYVVFASYSSDLVAGDTNGNLDCFLRDRVAGTTELVSVSTTGGSGDNSSWDGAVTPDGRYVAFLSYASNLIPSDTNIGGDVYVRDRVLGTTECVSLDSSGNQGDNSSWERTAISDDGRYVAFESRATNLVPGDTNNTHDIFMRDRLSGTTERVSVDSDGLQGNNKSEFPAMTPDGRFVIFRSAATNLVAGDTNGKPDVFLRDRQTGVTQRVSVGNGGVQGNDGSVNRPYISADGRYVEFSNHSSNLVPGDTNVWADIFVHDRQTSTTERVSVSTGGGQANGGSFAGTISRDGRYVGIHSQASNLVDDDTNGTDDVFVHDRVTGTTERVSTPSAGGQANSHSSQCTLSSDGRLVAFTSNATNLVAGDTNGDLDIFLRDRVLAEPLVTFCFPDQGGIRPCPCGNPPASGMVGCDNFGPSPAGGTGGAQLAATGTPSIASDTVQFQVTSEQTLASNITILFQGTTTLAFGAQSGAGVRCVAGMLKRIYKGNASAGAVSFPTGAQPDVHTASANLGFPIVPPVTLYYYAAYRNSAAGAPCGSASLGFNTTNAGALHWAP